MTGVRHITDVHRQVCNVLCCACSNVSVLAQFLHYAHMWMSRPGTYSWCGKSNLSQNHHVLYFISSHNGTLTRCGAQTNPSYHISWHMWPGAYSAWSLTIFDVSLDPNLSSTGIIRVTSGSNDTDTVPVSIKCTLPKPVVTNFPYLYKPTQFSPCAFVPNT